MFLKSLSIKGFKSFAEPTSLEFQPGVTVVVGPNGSGKSNIVDAVAWVLGAQGPRQVRATKMEDVIFAGTTERTGLGRAEVGLTIDNSSGILPIDFSEVTITRTLFRAGDSEYAINSVPCRLLDVQELLSDTGVGRQQHVIISQGNLDSVLNARPEDRRTVIEEAAGVLKYRRRKERAERRLAAAETGLERLGDLLKEVRRQLRPLEQQAKAAQRNEELRQAHRRARTFQLGREFASLQTELRSRQGDRTAQTQELETHRSLLVALDVEIEKLEGELSARGTSDISAVHGRLQQAKERCRASSAIIAQRQRMLGRDLDSLVDPETVSRVRAEVGSLGESIRLVDAEISEAQTSLAAVDENHSKVRRDLVVFEASENSQAHASEVVAQLSELRGELTAINNAVLAGNDEAARLGVREKELQTREVAISSRIEEFRLDLPEETSTLEESLEKLRLEIEACENDNQEAISRSRKLEGELAASNAEVAMLSRALDEARAVTGMARLRDLSGVVGSLLELVEIDAGYNAAVEAGFGEAIKTVVVEDESAGINALTRLEAEGVLGAVLVLTSNLRVVPQVLDAHLEPLRTRVRGRDSRIDAMLDRLLNNVVISSHSESAIAALSRNPSLIVVTKGGARFSVSGWHAGGESQGFSGAALQQAQTRTSQLETQMQSARQAEAEARDTLLGLRQSEKSKSAALESNQRAQRESRSRLERAEAELRQVRAESEALVTHLSELNARLGRDLARTAQLEAQRPELEAQEAGFLKASDERSAALFALQDRQRQVLAERNRLETSLAMLTERRSGLELRLSAATERLDELEASQLQAVTANRILSLQGAVLNAAQERVASIADRVDSWLSLVETERDMYSREVREIASRLEQGRKQRHDLERVGDETREVLRRVEVALKESELRVEVCIDTIRRELDLEPNAAVSAPEPELAEGVSLGSHVRELEREIRALGPINSLAIEEHAALAERHQFLQDQIDDVRKTRRELSKVISAIDAEIIEIFASAFADVANFYEDLFESLFPGGKGRLSLVDSSDLLNSGVEIEARPPGKNIKKLSLLSGGERSLAALAFLFAVFKARPSPFYLMDEVEPALDDINLQRFLTLLAEFRASAQLLIVTHQKRTMEVADAVYGVSMQKGGSSRVVSERVREVASLPDPTALSRSH